MCPATRASRELLARVRERNLAAFDHQDVPFEHVVRAVNPSRSMARNPLFQVMVVHRAPTADELSFDGLHVEGEPIATRSAKFDLAFSFVEGPAADRLACVVEYSSDLFEHGTVQHLTDRLVRLLEGAVADPGRPLRSIELLSGEERDHVLTQLGGSPHAVERATLPELFAAAAARDPGATAVVCEDERLTYAELDARAERLAGLLAARGCGPEDVVAVALPRSPQLVVALLAVSKAGAAFLPLDLDYPADRLAFMLADSAAALRADDARRSRALRRPRRAGARRPGARVAARRGRQRQRPHGRDRAPAQPRVRHLHLGLDGPSEGRRRHARGHREPRRDGRRADGRRRVEPRPAVRLA